MLRVENFYVLQLEWKCMALVHSSFRVESCLVVLSVLSLSCTCGQNYCWLDKITWQVFKCISLAKTITWQQNPFCYDYKLNFFSVAWRCSQINTAEKEKFNYFLSFWVILLPASGERRIKYMAMQSCFSVLQYDFRIVCLRLLDGGLSLDHCRCDCSIFDCCTFFFRHPSSCSCHRVANKTHLRA